MEPLQPALHDSLEGGRILIADDDETFRQAAIDLLGCAGFQVEAVRDATTAERALTERRYDLLIADIQMPGNCRLELLHTLRKKRITVPVILVTGHPTVPTAVEALRLSVVDYLIKPLDFSGVLDRIRHALGTGRLLQSLEQVRQETAHVIAAIECCEETLVGRPGPANEASDRAVKVDRAFSHLRTQVLKLVLTFNEAVALPCSTQETHLLDLCHLLSCPRRVAYEDALDETIAVLEKTKHAFRSKDLGVLRKRLEDLLAATRREGSSLPETSR